MAYPSNKAELLAVVQSIFSRTSAESRALFDNFLPAWTDELCDYAYWFLTIQPKRDFAWPVNLLTATPVVGDFLAAGWLRTVAGRAVYPLYAPYEDNQVSTAGDFHRASVRGVEFIKQMSDKGNFLRDLPVYSDNLSLSLLCGSKPGTPTHASIFTDTTGSYLEFSPTPSEAQLFAVSFTLRSTPWRTVSVGDVRNRWLTYGASSLVYKCLIKFAEFFKESTEQQKYEEMLHAPEVRGSSKMGELTRLRKETSARNQQLIEESAFYPTASQITGRSGYGGGRFGGRRFRGGYW